MPRPPATSWLARLTGRHRPRARRALEPADMGTAFGLEECLMSRLTEPPPVSPAAKSRWTSLWLRRARGG